MGVVEQLVEDGVPEGGVADGIVPVLDGELRGDDGNLCERSESSKDLKQIVSALA